MTLKRAVAIGVVGIALIGLLVWVFTPSPVDVDTARVARGTFMRTIDEDGKTRVRNRFVVSSPLAGTLQRLGLKEGDRVESGTVVANIVPAIPALLDVRSERELTARLEATEAGVMEANANIDRAEAALDFARAEATRIGNLATKGFVSMTERDAAALALNAREKELEAARQQRHAATHSLDAARAALSQALANAKDSTGKPWPVRAPVSGVVLRVLQESERGVLTGAPLLEIGNPADIELVVDVLSSDAVSIRPGDRVLFEHWGSDHPMEGRVRRVEPSAFTKISALGVEEQRVNVLIDPISEDESWRSVGDGYRVDVRIVVDERKEALTIPTSALFREGTQWMTFVVSNGTANKRAVSIAARGSKDAVVEAGLAQNDIVIVFPGSNISDGTRVKVAAGTR